MHRNMAMQEYKAPGTASSDAGAIVAVRGAQELTQEEYDKRVKDVRLC